MASALEHYRESERLLRLSVDSWEDDHGYTGGPQSDEELATRIHLQNEGRKDAALIASWAQAHALLAQVALTATDHAPGEDLTGWRSALRGEDTEAGVA